MTKLIPKPVLKPNEEEAKEKKGSTPKVRNAGHFLFEQNENHLMQVDSYPDLKSFKAGVKATANAISDDKAIPSWVHFRGKFEKIEIERIRDVKVKL